jgi:replicative DNA helicase
MNIDFDSLPFSEDAEKALICSLLLAPGAVRRLCANSLPVVAFYIPAHQILYKLVSEWHQPAEKVDHVWIRQTLKTRNLLDEVGGLEYLNQLYDFVPTSANASYYIATILENYQLRGLILASRQVASDAAQREANASELLLRFESHIKALSRVSNGSKPGFIEALSPSQFRNYEPPPGILLVGDNHIVRGSVFVIGGAPGVGKSRASVALAEAAATGHDWFGYPVHSKFKTLIIQNENGPYRLKLEFSQLDCETMDQYVRVTPPPPYGLCFERPEFQTQLRTLLEQFDPELVIIDPWNAAARDEKAKNYLEAFETLRSIIPAGDNAPAIGIVAHTRKPQVGERASGRTLLNLLAGSYVLGSVPRSVFIIQSASDDVEENRVVWTCCKNNDGELGNRSVWERRNGLFAPVHGFDWERFDHPESDKREITADMMAEVFDDEQLPKSEAKSRIMAKGFRKSAAYEALDPSGRFGGHLIETKKGMLKWKP